MAASVVPSDNDMLLPYGLRTGVQSSPMPTRTKPAATGVRSGIVPAMSECFTSDGKNTGMALPSGDLNRMYFIIGFTTPEI